MTHAKTGQSARFNTHISLPFAVAIVLFLLVGWWQSGTAIAKDDFGYLLWSLEERRNPFAWLAGPDWLSYHRPLNALAWWLAGQRGVESDLIRAINAGLWVGACSILASLARRPAPIAVAVLALLTNQIWIDLLTWRSWLTTIGSSSALLVGLAAVERRLHPVVVATAGIVALGFKEMAPLVLAIICLTTRGYRTVGMGLAGAVALTSVASAHKLDASFLYENILFHLETLALLLPVLPLALARRWPALPSWALLAASFAVALPTPLAAVLVLAASAIALADRPGWQAAVGAAWAIPQFGAVHARQYLIEGWLIVIVAVSMNSIRIRWAAVVAALALGLGPAIDFERSRAELRAQFVEQRNFLQIFKPPLANTLYRPDPMWSIDLDALWWVEQGASMRHAPPPGFVPSQVGPLSGVWADLANGQGSGNK